MLIIASLPDIYFIINFPIVRTGGLLNHENHEITRNDSQPHFAYNHHLHPPHAGKMPALRPTGSAAIPGRTYVAQSSFLTPPGRARCPRSDPLGARPSLAAHMSYKVLFLHHPGGQDARAPTHWERGHPWPHICRTKFFSYTTRAGKMPALRPSLL